VRLGTAEYMSPEYIAHHRLDSRSDLYALGAVLFQLLTGRPPYEGRTMRIMQDHVSAPVPRPSDYADRAPDWFDELVMQLMEKEPEDRPESAEVVAKVLSNHAETPTPKRRQRPSRGAPANPSMAPAGLSSMSHLAGESQPVYPEPKPAVPTTPLAITMGLMLAGILVMAMLGFVLGIGVLSLL